ncbi:SRPBCC family protein [Isoptericola hypogeus]|uniref:SRPBCC family protein n=1 Tax=Isoptericola hypogeus TaxID=300179 RepID=A0ABP4VYP4_9MICO
MSESTGRPDYDIEHAQVLAAPPAKVFAAFTDPDAFARWYGPDGVRTPREDVVIDAREGGTHRFTMVVDLDPPLRTTYDGRFTEVVPDRLLASSGAWEGIPGQDVPWPSNLRVELEPQPEGTLVVVREGPHPAGSVELGRESWRTMFPRLERVVTGS